MNRIMTDNEKLAHTILGPESEGRVMSMGNEMLVDNMIKDQAKVEFNQEVNDYIEKFDKHSEYLDAYKEKFKEEAKDLEIMPLYRYVLIKPFEENPFQQVQRQGSIITDLGGQKPIYQSRETGEWEEEESYIHVGLVLEVGPKTEFLKEGDVVMFPKNSEFPIPFYKQGFIIVDEQRISAVINEGLHERFENLSK